MQEQLDRIEAAISRLTVATESLVDLLRSVVKAPPRTGSAIATGIVRQPTDLGPAIAALPDAARARMYERLNGSPPTPDAIAEAADWHNALGRAA